MRLMYNLICRAIKVNNIEIIIEIIKEWLGGKRRPELMRGLTVLNLLDPKPPCC